MRSKGDLAFEIGLREQFYTIGAEAASLAFGGKVATTDILLYKFRDDRFVKYPECAAILLCKAPRVNGLATG